jgi:hypothetical protein
MNECQTCRGSGAVLILCGETDEPTYSSCPDCDGKRGERMNAKELIEAAKRIGPIERGWTEESDAAFALAQHFLATVRPDDDEPPSKDRIVADGWKYYELLHNREEYVHPNGMAIVCDNGEYRRYGTVLQTMRKVRLVAALGE